jgi:hypothetical protein
MTEGRTSRLAERLPAERLADVRLIARYLPAAGVSLAILGAVGVVAAFLMVQLGSQDRAVTEAWNRAVDAEPGIVHVFERGDAGQSNLHATSMNSGAKPLVVGERVTLVTPDGAIHTLRVCDPASASASIAPDCLNAFVARAVPPATTPVPQRSL